MGVAPPVCLSPSQAHQPGSLLGVHIAVCPVVCAACPLQVRGIEVDFRGGWALARVLQASGQGRALGEGMRRHVTRQSVLTPELSCMPCLCPPASRHHHACAASQRASQPACRCTRAERWALRAWMWSTATSEKWGRVSAVHQLTSN